MDGKKIALVGVIALLVVGGGVLFATQSDKSNKEETQQSAQQQESKEMTKEDQTIVALAVATPDLSTLVTAVKAADLVDTLSGSGPFTVFAPTNDAFAKLPAGTVDTLLKPENIEQLKGILTYHVVPSSAVSGDLEDGQVLTTVQGNQLTVKIADGKVTLTDAKGGVATVTQADIKGSNGVVHVIDSVLMPM